MAEEVKASAMKDEDADESVAARNGRLDPRITIDDNMENGVEEALAELVEVPTRELSSLEQFFVNVARVHAHRETREAQQDARESELEAALARVALHVNKARYQVESAERVLGAILGKQPRLILRGAEEDVPGERHRPLGRSKSPESVRLAAATLIFQKRRALEAVYEAALRASEALQPKVQTMRAFVGDLRALAQFWRLVRHPEGAGFARLCEEFRVGVQGTGPDGAPTLLSAWLVDFRLADMGLGLAGREMGLQIVSVTSAGRAFLPGLPPAASLHEQLLRAQQELVHRELYRLLIADVVSAAAVAAAAGAAAAAAATAAGTGAGGVAIVPAGGVGAAAASAQGGGAPAAAAGAASAEEQMLAARASTQNEIALESPESPPLLLRFAQGPAGPLSVLYEDAELARLAEALALQWVTEAARARVPPFLPPRIAPAPAASWGGAANGAAAAAAVAATSKPPGGRQGLLRRLRDVVWHGTLVKRVRHFVRECVLDEPRVGVRVLTPAHTPEQLHYAFRLVARADRRFLLEAVVDGAVVHVVAPVPHAALAGAAAPPRLQLAVAAECQTFDHFQRMVRDAIARV